LASFFRFEDIGRQDARVFLSSILVQLSNQSVPFRYILLEFFTQHTNVVHNNATKEGSLRDVSRRCSMTQEKNQFTSLQTLDECPDISGLQSSREKVLGPIEELVGFHLYVSASQVALRSTSEMFSNQRRDDVDIKLNMLGWKVKDKLLVIKTPTV
jgi:hypothetical protein